MTTESHVLNEKIDILIKLIALALARDKTQVEAINLLSKSGLAPSLIANILGTTSNVVRVTKHKSQKKKRTKKIK
jgi:DNA-binding CsgD family transcriptional regulator